MPRLNYALVSERSLDAPIYRKGWRPIRPKPYAKPASGVGVAAVLATRRRLYGDVRAQAPAATCKESVVQMDVDPAPWAHNFEIPAWNIDFPDPARRHPDISADAPKARSARVGWGMAFPSPVVENTPVSPRKAKAHEESGEPTVTPPPAHVKAEKAPMNLSKPTAGIGSAAVLASRTRLHGDIRLPTRAATSQGPVVRMDVNPAPWAHNIEVPTWNINFPNHARSHPENTTDAPKARSAWGGWGSIFPSPVLESTPICTRQAEAHEEYTIHPPVVTHPNAEEARRNLSASSAESSPPISSRKAEKSRARVDVPPTSLRKAEKAQIRDDPTEPVNTTPSTSSWKAEESRLPAPIHHTITTVNMASSSKVKLEHMPLPAINLSAPVFAGVQVNNTSSTSLNRPIENIKPSVLPPREPTIVTSSTVRQSDNSNDVTDVVMFEDDYVGFPPTIGGYAPEYGDYMLVDPVGVAATRNDGIRFDAAPLDVPEFMEVDWEGPSIPSGNPLGNVAAHHNPVINGPPYAGPPVMVENIFGLTWVLQELLLTTSMGLSMLNLIRTSFSPTLGSSTRLMTQENLFLPLVHKLHPFTLSRRSLKTTSS